MGRNAYEIQDFDREGGDGGTGKLFSKSSEE